MLRRTNLDRFGEFAGRIAATISLVGAGSLAFAAAALDFLR